MGDGGTIQSITVDKNSLSPNPKYIGFPGGSSGKESACNAEESGSIPGSGQSLGGGHGNHSSILSGESYGQRSLAGYSLRGLKESDMTE